MIHFYKRLHTLCGLYNYRSLRANNGRKSSLKWQIADNGIAEVNQATGAESAERSSTRAVARPAISWQAARRVVGEDPRQTGRGRPYLATREQKQPQTGWSGL